MLGLAKSSDYRRAALRAKSTTPLREQQISVRHDAAAQWLAANDAMLAVPIFNKIYRQRRLEAQSRGELFPSYSAALACFQKNLALAA